MAEKDETRTKTGNAAAIADLKAAMAKGYPMAFNNMANALQRGEGVAKDADKAADLYMETLNRVIHCCWVPIARHLLIFLISGASRSCVHDCDVGLAARLFNAHGGQRSIGIQSKKTASSSRAKSKSSGASSLMKSSPKLVAIENGFKASEVRRRQG
jgi:hypothetical protein